MQVLCRFRQSKKLSFFLDSKFWAHNWTFLPPLLWIHDRVNLLAKVYVAFVARSLIVCVLQFRAPRLQRAFVPQLYTVVDFSGSSPVHLPKWLFEWFQSVVQGRAWSYECIIAESHLCRWSHVDLCVNAYTEAQNVSLLFIWCCERSGFPAKSVRTSRDRCKIHYGGILVWNRTLLVTIFRHPVCDASSREVWKGVSMRGWRFGMET